MGLRSKPAKLDRDALWEYALRTLGRRAQSASEVRQKLARRAANPADVTEVMTRLREYGFADDQKFSENFASFRLQNQGFGQQRVIRDLRSKRVPEATAKQAVQSAYSGTDEAQLIDSFLARKYRGKDLREFLKEPKNLNSAYRRLRMAGFSSAATLKTLRRFTDSAEEWDESEEQ
jgi:regulatory protein